MIKKVNVQSLTTIRTVTPMIYGNVKNISMSTGDIMKCLCARATVDEIMPDGSLVRLNIRNYNDDNTAAWKAAHPEPKAVESKPVPPVTEPVKTVIKPELANTKKLAVIDKVEVKEEAVKAFASVTAEHPKPDTKKEEKKEEPVETPKVEDKAEENLILTDKVTDPVEEKVEAPVQEEAAEVETGTGPVKEIVDNNFLPEKEEVPEPTQNQVVETTKSKKNPSKSTSKNKK